MKDFSNQLVKMSFGRGKSVRSDPNFLKECRSSVRARCRIDRCAPPKPSLFTKPDNANFLVQFTTKTYEFNIRIDGRCKQKSPSRREKTGLQYDHNGLSLFGARGRGSKILCIRFSENEDRHCTTMLLPFASNNKITAIETMYRQTGDLTHCWSVTDHRERLMRLLDLFAISQINDQRFGLWSRVWSRSVITKARARPGPDIWAYFGPGDPY